MSKLRQKMGKSGGYKCSAFLLERWKDRSSKVAEGAGPAVENTSYCPHQSTSHLGLHPTVGNKARFKIEKTSPDLRLKSKTCVS